MSEEKQQSRVRGIRWWYILLAAVLLGIALASSYSLVKLFIYSDLMQRLLGMLQSPLALVPAVILLLLLRKYPKFSEYQKHITLAVLYGAGAVVFVILCGLRMGVDYVKLITTHPPWIYISAIAAVPAVILTWYWRQMNNVKKQDYDEYSEINERFAKATEMLGSNIIEQCLGAIYQLERIAQDSPRDHWVVMETLCAYIRENAVEAHNEDEKKTFNDEQPLIDIQAILTVIGRRKHSELENLEPKNKDYKVLDFRGAFLKGADLSEGMFSKALFTKAHLEGALFTGANLKEANLKGAKLSKANLESAVLFKAHLERANLSEAHLEGADLRDARLEGQTIIDGHYMDSTDLRKAHLEGARLKGAHLEGTWLKEAHLEGAHLEGAIIQDADFSNATYDNKTIFPHGFNPADHGMINLDEPAGEIPDDENPA